MSPEVVESREAGIRLATECILSMGTPIRRVVYYCPKCDRTISKERVGSVDRELKERFDIDRLSKRRCPVCDAEYIDLDKVPDGGRKHVGKGRQTGSP
jgi:hypothetical protein